MASIFDDPIMQKLEREKCRRDPWHWLTTWALTLDPHDKETPIKPFPIKEYLKNYIDIWISNNLIAVPKSRQMMISWINVALFLWDTQFGIGRFTFFQSKKEDDANKLVKRAKFINENQPEWLAPRGQNSYCSLSFPTLNSIILGIPQGGDQIRMNTASGIFMDEAAFMPEAYDALVAAKPTIVGGGKLVMVSSANPGFFARVVADEDLGGGLSA